MGWTLNDFGFRKLFSLTPNKYGIIPLFLTNKDRIQLFKLRQYTNNQQPKILHRSKRIAMNGEIPQSLPFRNFDQLLKRMNIIAVQVQSSQLWEMPKIIIESL